MTSRTPVFLLLAVTGAAIGIGVLLWDANSTCESRKFIAKPEFIVWALLIGMLTAFFAIAPFIIVKSFKEIRQFWSGSRIEIALSSLIFLFLVCIPFYFTRYVLQFNISFPLVHHSLKIPFLAAIGFITTALPASIGIWLVHSALKEAFNDSLGQKHLDLFLQLQQRLRRFLSVLGSVIGLLTLATGALRKALLAYGIKEQDFPGLLVLVYGAYFTILVGLVYIPIHVSLLGTGRRLRDAFCPLPNLDSGSWQNAYSKRNQLEEYLQLRISAQQNLQSGVVIMAPLISGIISVLLS